MRTILAVAIAVLTVSPAQAAELWIGAATADITPDPLTPRRPSPF